MSIKSFKAGNCQTTLFAEVGELFKKLDDGLNYPNCEGHLDERRLTQWFEKEFYKLLDKKGISY